jgi:23S rRNA (cytosine1962-C5)-methyltransferase
MKVYLKKGKEKAINQKHLWIFSGAVNRVDPGILDGDIVEVYSDAGKILGSGYYNSLSQIIVRMLIFGDDNFNLDFLSNLIKNAIEKRESDPLLKNCSLYRLINSEGDFLPGLVADYYSGNIVLQFLTLGMDKMKKDIIDIIKSQFNPNSIYERSDHAGRKAEGLEESSGEIFGTSPEEIICEERGMKFIIDIRKGQKTGFFIDQRENRDSVKRLSIGRKVLNLFCYTGGFSVAALSGGCENVISVDSSAPALSLLERNIELNGFKDKNNSIHMDVFDYINTTEFDSDFIIADPPSFAKSKGNLNKALRGYKDLNYRIFKKCKPGTMVLTFSCSRFIDIDLFQKVIFSSALDSGRKVSIISKAGHASDHPVNIYVPETEYLKSVLLLVE